MTFQFADQLIQVSRLKTTSGSKRAYVATATAEGSIQPLGSDKGEVGDGVFGQTFHGYVEAHISIQDGDRIKDLNNGNIYQVEGVVERSIGSLSHKELLLVRSKKTG